MAETLQPIFLNLSVDWFPNEPGDFAYPVLVKIQVGLRVKPNSTATLLKNAGHLTDINKWGGWVLPVDLDGGVPIAIETIADDNSTQVQPTVDNIEETRAESFWDKQGNLYSADDEDGGLVTPHSSHETRVESKNDSSAKASFWENQVYSADGDDVGVTTPRSSNETKAEGKTDASSTASSITVRTPSIVKKASKIPVRVSGVDGAFDSPYSDQLNLPPSPSASSQGRSPWTSSQEIMSYLETSEQSGKCDVDLDSLSGLLDPPPVDPFVTLEDGEIKLFASSDVVPGLYTASVILYENFVQIDNETWVLDLSEIVASCPEISGFIKIFIRFDEGYQNMIYGIDDLVANEGILESTIDPRDRPFVTIHIRKLRGDTDHEMLDQVDELPVDGNIISEQHSYDDDRMVISDETNNQLNEIYSQLKGQGFEFMMEKLMDDEEFHKECWKSFDEELLAMDYVPTIPPMTNDELQPSIREAEIRDTPEKERNESIEDILHLPRTYFEAHHRVGSAIDELDVEGTSTTNFDRQDETDNKGSCTADDDELTPVQFSYIEPRESPGRDTGEKSKEVDSIFKPTYFDIIRNSTYQFDDTTEVDSAKPTYFDNLRDSTDESRADETTEVDSAKPTYLDTLCESTDQFKADDTTENESKSPFIYLTPRSQANRGRRQIPPTKDLFQLSPSYARYYGTATSDEKDEDKKEAVAKKDEPRRRFTYLTPRSRANRAKRESFETDDDDDIDSPSYGKSRARRNANRRVSTSDYELKSSPGYLKRRDEEEMDVETLYNVTSPDTSAVKEKGNVAVRQYKYFMSPIAEEKEEDVKQPESLATESTEVKPINLVEAASTPQPETSFTEESFTVFEDESAHSKYDPKSEEISIVPPKSKASLYQPLVYDKSTATEEDSEAIFGGPCGLLFAKHLNDAETPMNVDDNYTDKKDLQHELRERVISSLCRLLPALFIFVFTVCVCMGGPPEPISTPTKTFYTAKYYAYQLGDLGSTAFKSVNTSFYDFKASFRTSTTAEVEDLGLPMSTPNVTAQPTECPCTCNRVAEFFESTANSSSTTDSLDAELTIMAELETAKEIQSVNATSATMTFVMESAPSTSISTTPFKGHPNVSSTAICPASHNAYSNISLATKENTKPKDLERTTHPRPQIPPSLPSTSLSVMIPALTMGLLRHIACSTSAVCVIGRVSDKYDPPWQVFSRFECDGQGGWRASTARDSFDRALGWTPAECQIN